MVIDIGSTFISFPYRWICDLVCAKADSMAYEPWTILTSSYMHSFNVGSGRVHKAATGEFHPPLTTTDRKQLSSF
jgi:hypothetical protein